MEHSNHRPILASILGVSSGSFKPLWFFQAWTMDPSCFLVVKKPKELRWLATLWEKLEQYNQSLKSLE